MNKNEIIEIVNTIGCTALVSSRRIAMAAGVELTSENLNAIRHECCQMSDDGLMQKTTVDGNVDFFNLVEYPGELPQLTEASAETFKAYANDADNWSGMPYVSNGNVKCTKQTRGNISDLVQKGLVIVEKDELGQYIVFTAKGKKLAASMGVEL